MSPHDDALIESVGTHTKPPAPRFYVLQIALVACAMVLLSRAFYLQVAKGSSFRSEAEGNRILGLTVPAPRGIIYDSTGKQLVENVASTNAVIDPAKLPAGDAETVLLDNLPKLLSISVTTVRDTIIKARATQRVTLLESAVNHEKTLALEKALPDLPGVSLESSLVRKYHNGQVIAPVLGYTSLVTAPELKDHNTLKSTDTTGKAGLEAQYDNELRGQCGVSYVEVNAAGKPQKQLEKIDPTAGAEMRLNLDIGLEEYIFSLWQERAAQTPQEPVSGTVIALDPRSGAVRALISYPSYDPNIFSQPALRDQTSQVFKDELYPLMNRAIGGTFPPGSTIKPALAAAALQEKVITPDSTILSVGGINIGPWHFPDWKAGGHGMTNVIKAIAESVNSFFYVTVGGDDTHQGLGVQRATKYLKQFGWGEPTGIDLPGEVSGFLPSPEWKLQAKKEAWYIGDTYHLAIGQGDVLVSPLQIATTTAVIANGGKFYQPLLVNSLKNAAGETLSLKPKSRSVGISGEHIATVRRGMRETVLSGSGRALQTLPLPIAGKTGTAQIGGTEATHAWFTSFGPYNSPDLVLTILIEKGGAGDQEAVPMAQQIWQWWYDHRGIKP